ncbi:MAG TPA: Crp/Fnr family transcriptional regulator [Aggregatilineales bacterium]|nr:Crp/Fnr family transcriptional regulator [Aggregatilineales bacterium]
MSNVRDILPAIGFFSDLPPSALEKLASTAHLTRLDRDDVLFHQGDEAASAYVVIDGRLRLVQHSADGKDVTMATFVPGDMIGLVVALTGEPYPGTLEALETSQLLILPGSLMWELLTAYAPLGVRVIRLLAERLIEAYDRIRELSAERVQQRVARSLLRLTQKVGVPAENGSVRLDIRLSRQDLAQMNGTTLETISRTLSAWEADQIIAAGREQIVILKPHALVRIAEDLPA